MHIVGPLISALLSCISALTPGSHPLGMKTAVNPYLLGLLKTKDIGLFLTERQDCSLPKSVGFEGPGIHDSQLWHPSGAHCCSCSCFSKS